MAVIELAIKIRFDSTKRPICIDCEHSVMSHGEKDGKLYCWPCAGTNKECNAGVVYSGLLPSNGSEGPAQNSYVHTVRKYV